MPRVLGGAQGFGQVCRGPGGLARKVLMTLGTVDFSVLNIIRGVFPGSPVAVTLRSQSRSCIQSLVRKLGPTGPSGDLARPN